jgi:hypothetical protein
MAIADARQLKQAKGRRDLAPTVGRKPRRAFGRSALCLRFPMRRV